MNRFWELTLRDGTKIKIPPSGVEVVKRRWEAGQPIKTSRQVIPVNQIINFEQTTETDTPLLEAASQAFNEPLYEDRDGEQVIKARWVKKEVTQREWNKYYQPHSYRKLDESSGIVTVAFKQPVHQITPNLSYCTPEEINRLTNN